MIQYPIKAGETLTRVLEAGRIDAPPVLLVHGIGSRADRWEHNIATLAAHGYRVIACDLPGHGFATKDPAFPHCVSSYARFINDVLDTLNLREVSLVGASLGGHIAGLVAMSRPSAVENLVLVGSTGLAPYTADRTDSYVKSFQTMTFQNRLERLRRLFSDPSVVTDDLAREDVAFNTSPGAVECLVRLASSLPDDGNNCLLTNALRALENDVPLMLVWGTEDVSVDVAIGVEAHASLPASRLELMPYTNHSPYYEKPREFNEILVDFLRQRGPSSVRRTVL